VSGRQFRRVLKPPENGPHPLHRRKFSKVCKEQCGLSLKKETIQQKIDFSRKAAKYLRISSIVRTGVSPRKILFQTKGA
jgi:hypothetical protein